MTSEQRREIVRTGALFSRFDIVFFVAVVVIIAAVFFAIYAFGGNAATVEIKSPKGKLVRSLAENARIDVDGLLTVVIEDGKVHVENAVCPDKVCEHTGKVDRCGAMIACLPSGIVVYIAGESDFVEVG